MNLFLGCGDCGDSEVKAQCKTHAIYLCGSHISTHLGTNNKCEMEGIRFSNKEISKLQKNLTIRVKLLLDLKKSILHTTKSLIHTLETNSNTALCKLELLIKKYKEILNSNLQTVIPKVKEEIISSVWIKHSKTKPTLNLNNYFSGEFFDEKPKAFIKSSLNETLNYLSTTWDLNLQGHTKPVLSLAINTETNTLYTGSLDKTIKVWDLSSKNLEKTLRGHENGVTCLALSANLSKLVSGSSDCKIKVWDLEKDSEAKTLEEHRNVVLCICLTPSNQELVSGSADCLIILWDFNSLVVKNIFREHQNWVLTLSASPDNQFLASGSKDKNSFIKLWKLNPLESVNLVGHSNDVSCVVFSVDSRILISGSLDKSIKVWSTESFLLLSSLDQHSKSVSCLAVKFDMLFSASEDLSIKVWDLNELRLKSSKSIKYTVKCMVLDNMKDLVITAFKDKNILKIWTQNLEGDQELNQHFGEIQQTRIFDNYQKVASYAADGLKIWRIADKTLIKTVKTIAEVLELNLQKELEKFLQYLS